MSPITALKLPPLPLPSLSLTTSSPASPRTRSTSLSAARSPSFPTSFSLPDPSHSPYGLGLGAGYHAGVSQSKTRPPHRRGASLSLPNSSASTPEFPESLAYRQGREKELEYEEAELEDEMLALGGEEEMLMHHLPVEEGRGQGARQTAYDGPFQAPDSREVVGMTISFVVVLMLALAAGLTTIYDWVV